MNKPFIIAEMSGNHNHSLERALKIVDAVAETGADALKLQTYTADTLTLNLDENEFFISNPESLWKGESLYHLYSRAYTPWEWHKPIFDRCKEKGLLFFSTPFDDSAVSFLETLNVPMYKVAAFENGDIPLLEKIASTHKPVIMSVGMVSPVEIAESVAALENGGCPSITLLKCTSTYPASPEDSNLLTIPDLKKRFPQCRIGLSDHTQGIGVALGAIALGAEIIEKHVTLSREDGGVDNDFSMEPDELRQLVQEAERTALAVGHVSYELSESEKQSLVFRRSIYVSKDIPEGKAFTEENIRIIRPGLGLHPRYYHEILGKTAACNLKRGTALKFDHIRGIAK